MSTTEDMDVQVLIRAHGDQRNHWKEAAESAGMSLSAWIRFHLDTQAVLQLTPCQHPRSNRRTYPWSETCTLCGVRLRDGDTWLVPEQLR